MKYYKAYIEREGYIRKGAKSGGVKAEKKVGENLWVSFESPYIIWDYLDGQNNVDRQMFLLQAFGSGDYVVRFFDGEQVIATDEDLFSLANKEVKKKVTKKKVSKKGSKE